MEEQQTQISIGNSSLPPLVAMFPSPGMGHLIPMIEFAKRLTRHHTLAVTFIIPTEGPPTKAQTTVLRSLPRGISHTFLPPVTLSDVLPPNPKLEARVSHTLLRSLPSLRHTLLSLSSSHRLTAFVVDLIGTDAFDVATELNVPSYIYFTTSATALSFGLSFPDFYQQLNGKDLPEPLNIPGCISLNHKDLPEPFHDRNNNEAFKWFLHHVKRLRLAKGIIENSFLDLEPVAIKMLMQKNELSFYPVGPLVDEDCDRTLVDQGDECLKWLDEQPRSSALFVCFGSGGTLSNAQMDELAFGLEMSEERFLWVVKTPNENTSDAFYFDGDKCVDPFVFLPKDFAERTRGKGLVVPSWAPQAQVLSHGSVGGFLTHCGWNSILESVVNGVPLVAWPLYAEQGINAVLVTEEVKVALRPKVNENNGLVERQEIASVVKKLMKGEEGMRLRERMKKLKAAAAGALCENGSSTKQIAELALKWHHKSTVTSDH